MVSVVLGLLVVVVALGLVAVGLGALLARAVTTPSAAASRQKVAIAALRRGAPAMRSVSTRSGLAACLASASARRLARHSK